MIAKGIGGAFGSAAMQETSIVSVWIWNRGLPSW